MPIAIDPNSRLPVVLSSDEGKSNPPTFYVRPLTLRETRSTDTIDQRIKEAADAGGDAYEPLTNGIKTALVGWSNVVGIDGQAIAFDLEKLEDVLSLDECFELMRKIVNAGSLLRDEKKRLESPPSSNTDNSAKDAPAGSVLTAPAT